MTTVYFVRHAQSSHEEREEALRRLSPKGMADRLRVTDFLSDKGIGAALSSPYRRAIDTISDFTEKNGLSIEVVEDFREWKGSAHRPKNFDEICRQHWEDPDYQLSDGESLRDVQRRNISALERV